MSTTNKATSVTSIYPRINDLDQSVNNSNISNTHTRMSSPSGAQREMEQVGRNSAETKNIVPSQRKDSYSATKDSSAPSKDKPKRKGSSGSRPKKTQVEDIADCHTCAVRPKNENIMDHVPFYKKCQHKLCCKLFVFLVIGLLNVADLVSDWLLFRDVALTENGLVYGAVEDSLKYSLLAFSVIGTLTFTFEVANLWWEIFRNNPWVDSDLSSAITVWIEDVPQIGINVAIVACREEAISYFQLVKASVIILGAVIRIAVSLFKYCSKTARHDLECAKENKESCHHVVYRAFIMVGLLLTLGGAIAIFMFTQSERNPDGSINFKAPHSVIAGEFDDQKYFDNVSIYFSYNMSDFTPPTARTDVNLINLVQINEIRKKDYDVAVNLAYEDISGGRRKFLVSRTLGATQKIDCFEMDTTNKAITRPTTCTGYITTATSELVFKFHFIKAKLPGLIFGDITYNVKEKLITTHSEVTFIIEDDIDKRLGNPAVAAMHYFRTDNVDGQHPIIHMAGTGGRFYNTTDLIDVKDVWQTGYATCKSSGSAAPHYDSGVSVH